MHFSKRDDYLSKKYNDIWNKVSNSVDEEFDIEPIYNKKILKTKIRPYGDDARDIQDEELPSGSFNSVCS